MAYTPNNPNGQATMANSAPVVIASNQTAFPITLDKTNFTQSSGNNTSAQLAASATFTGSIESGLSHPNLIISVRCDQPFTMTIKQYSDAAGTIAYPDIVYTRLANVGYNDTITLAGSYFRVVLQNTGASTTTNLFVETWMGILPVSINPTNLGNNPTSINEVGGTALTLGQKATTTSIPTVQSAADFVTGQGTQTVVGQNILLATAGTAAIDVSGYNSFSCQVVSTGTAGTFQFEGSNDGTNFGIVQVTNTTTTGVVSTTITASASQITYIGAVNFRYLRLRIATTITGGSLQAFTRYSTNSYSTSINTVSQSVGANLQMTPASTPLMTGAIASATCSDATANPTGYGTRVFGHLFNGATWDRPQNNYENTLLASSARTTTQTSADIINFNGQNLIVVLNMTVVGTGSVTVSIDGKDSASGTYYNILTGAAITTNSSNRYRIGKTLTAVANSVAQDYLPRVFRIVVTANNANSATYSVGYNIGL